MCNAPKIEKPPAPPPPPPVLEQVAPEMKKVNAEAAKKGGTKKYQAPGSSLSIGGVSGSTSGVGISR